MFNNWWSWQPANFWGPLRQIARVAFAFPPSGTQSPGQGTPLQAVQRNSQHVAEAEIRKRKVLTNPGVTLTTKCHLDICIQHNPRPTPVWQPTCDSLLSQRLLAHFFFLRLQRAARCAALAFWSLSFITWFHHPSRQLGVWFRASGGQLRADQRRGRFVCRLSFAPGQRRLEDRKLKKTKSG